MSEFTYTTELVHRQLGIVSIFENGKERRYAVNAEPEIPLSIEYLEKKAHKLIDLIKKGASNGL